MTPSTDADDVSWQPSEVHLVGSIPLADTATVFETVAKSLPARLHSIPDGETGKRTSFVGWQAETFAPWPELISRRQGMLYNSQGGTSGPSEEDLRALMSSIQNSEKGLETGYDKYAIESYEEFQNLQAAGKIEKGVKFQVCLPSALSAMMRVNPEYQYVIEPLYETALLKAVDNIQRVIPHDQLLLQWDLPREIASLEGIGKAPWLEPNIMEEVVLRCGRLVAATPPDVEVGIHLCYGDFGHKHFVQPKDASILTDLTNRIVETTYANGKALAFVHMPVPIDRDDKAYFEPLKDLKLSPGTKLYLGLVHANDLDGTRRRIETAREILPDTAFGISTECGMGRTPPEELTSIFEILKIASRPSA